MRWRSPGKVHASFSYHGVHAIGELGNDVIALGRMKSREHLGITRIGAAGTHVISQASLEQSIILEHERNGTHQLLGRNSSHIRPAYKNDTLICVPKARDERRERRLCLRPTVRREPPSPRRERKAIRCKAPVPWTPDTRS